MPTGVYKRKPRTIEYCRNISMAKKGKKRPDMIGNKFTVGIDPWNKGKAYCLLSKKHFWINKSGYKILENHGNRNREHRLLVQNKIGRNLSENEVVHHINRDKIDNRLENLEIMTRKQHVILHKPRSKKHEYAIA